ncbi:MAG TPA: hypothetical protein VH063_19580 [Gaiellaceae bacterium]|jgi:hypothetical protein|nr:hypothetical protein [Gaiellaceae bacterium]
MNRVGSAWKTTSRLVGTFALLAALFVVAPGAQARTDDNPAINVQFSVSGQIAVSLVDGTPVGTSSGTPTVIPAGYYTLEMIGPGGCANVPYFDLKGPGTSIVDNMDEGEVATSTINLHLLPNSTYTWRNDDVVPSVVYTFTTSGATVGAPPVAVGKSGLSSSDHGTAASVNPFRTTPEAAVRGKLTGLVSAAGRLTISYKGKSVKSLKPGKYTIVVTDKSSTSGFMLSGKSKSVSVTGGSYVGKKTRAVNLTAGKWVFAPALGGKQAFAVTVA